MASNTKDVVASAPPSAVQVGIVLGSASDLMIVEKAVAVLDELGISHQVAVASAHRTPKRVEKFIVACQQRGAKVFIAAAGLSAALPGVVASQTVLPVIGLPINAGQVGGLDALLSVAQMPPGIPVACVGLDAAINSALLAAAIIAVENPLLTEALKNYRSRQAEKSAAAHKKHHLSSLV